MIVNLFPAVDLGRFCIKDLRVLIEPTEQGDGVRIRSSFSAEDATGFNPGIRSLVLMEERRHCVEWERFDARFRARVIRELCIRTLTHELDEWLRVDGKIINEAHPENHAWITKGPNP